MPTSRPASSTTGGVDRSVHAGCASRVGKTVAPTQSRDDVHAVCAATAEHERVVRPLGGRYNHVPMDKATLRGLETADLSGRPVLLRADLNAPLEEERVVDDTRVRETLPTVRLLRDAGARIVVISHLGRPEGRPEARYSLRPVIDRLRELLGGGVRFHEGLAGPRARAAARELEPGGVLALENTRFDPREPRNDACLADALAELGELFVNDAFGAAHRAHASTVGVAEKVRARGGLAVAGLLMERELDFLGRIAEDPERPFVAVLGGAKISGKIDVIRSLLPRVDRLLVGGAMANTFFLALGLDTGRSLVEPASVETARACLEAAGERLLLPVDCVVAERFEPGAPTRVVPRDAVGAGDRIGDIGPASRSVFAAEMASARTIVWNGPMGVFEHPPFGEGTAAVALAAGAAMERDALTVVGGGDSVAAAEAAGVAARLSHVSTGGGASLDFLAGCKLPGVAALSDR